MPIRQVVPETGKYSLSARNSLSGSVNRLHDDDVDAEVVKHLTNGDRLVVTITKNSAKKLGISLGFSMISAFKSNPVMLAGLSPMTA
jgi:molybdate transport system regulatory protein